MRSPFLVFAVFAFALGPAAAAQQLTGHVQGGGGPIAKATVRCAPRDRVLPWVANNIDQMSEVCIEKDPDPALSTRCGGNGFVEFLGLAKPMKTPVVGGQVHGW
ncbi:MAG TPA: hypothetical protein VE779_02455 [Candidatus Angelobacter sp.]|nr:hypothetical protein [Candidatus Angelobacter sp.]